MNIHNILLNAGACMVDKVDVKKINSDSSIQRELSTIGNGDNIIEKKEVDENRDGYLDCKYFKGPGQFIKWQNELFRAGLIHRLHIMQFPFTCKDPTTKPLTFDYLKMDDSEGTPRVYAYFSSEDRARLFHKLNHLPDKEIIKVNASLIERTDSTMRENVDPNKPTSAKFHKKIDDINRPEKGLSKSGYYYRIDVTEYLGIPLDKLSLINKSGSESANCFNASLYFAGLTDKLEFIKSNDLFPILEESSTHEIVKDRKAGDIVVWYKEYAEKYPVHAFIGLGYGWILTKNGKGDKRPYRFQRLEYARHLYSQIYIGKTVAINLKEARYRTK